MYGDYTSSRKIDFRSRTIRDTRASSRKKRPRRSGAKRQRVYRVLAEEGLPQQDNSGRAGSFQQERSRRSGPKLACSRKVAFRNKSIATGGLVPERTAPPKRGQVYGSSGHRADCATHTRWPTAKVRLGHRVNANTHKPIRFTSGTNARIVHHRLRPARCRIFATGTATMMINRSGIPRGITQCHSGGTALQNQN